MDSPLLYCFSLDFERLALPLPFSEVSQLLTLEESTIIFLSFEDRDFLEPFDFFEPTDRLSVYCRSKWLAYSVWK